MENEELKVVEKKLPEAQEERNLAPFFVEAEKMFDKFAAISTETAQKAFEFFRARGGELGREIDDWLHAEAKVLRFVPMEITEKNGTVNVIAQVPGFKPDEIEISVDNKTLMISGETLKKEENTDANVVYSDFESNRFFRRMMLPTAVDADKAKAEIKDGILTIAFPKAEEAKPKQIAVAGG